MEKLQIGKYKKSERKKRQKVGIQKTLKIRKVENLKKSEIAEKKQGKDIDQLGHGWYCWSCF